MSKTKKRQVFAEECVFSAQEFEVSGIRELSFEELLKVNGGRQVKDDPRTDRNSDVCRSSGRSSRGNSSGSSSRGSSSSGGSSSRGGSSGSYGSSSSSRGASGGGSSSPSKGSSSSGSSGRGSSAHDSSSRRNTGSSKGSVSSGSASGSSSKNSQSSSFGETKPSNPSKPDRKEERSSTVGGGSSGNTSFGRNTGSSGGGGSFDRSSPSRDRDSSDRDSSRSDRYSSGSSVSSGSTVYTPPVQSQPVPAPAAEKTTAPVQSQVQSEQNKNTSVSAPQNSAEPNKGEESSPTQGGVAPQGESAATVRNQGKNAGAANSGTKGGVLSGFKEFWGNAGNSVGKAVRGVKDTVGDRLTRLNKKIEEETTNSSNNSQPINDFKLPEKRKRESAVYMSFDKSEETLKITSYRMLANGDWQPTHVTTISARNHVRNELNNLRETPDATTFPLDGSESQWYFPRQFPNGVWECRTSRISTNPDISGVFIPTNAFQDVPVYGPKSQEKPTPNLDGNYIPTGIQTDTGYGIHFAPNGTWGCIGLESKQDAAWLANKIDVALESSNGFALLRVKD